MGNSKIISLLIMFSLIQIVCAGGEPRVQAEMAKAADPQTTASADGDPVKGKEIFESDTGCNVCHGMDALGSVGPNIRQVTLAQVAHAMQNFPDMINWSYNFPELFSEPSLKDVVAYLNTLEREPAPE